MLRESEEREIKTERPREKRREEGSNARRE
jgi:hypothetical protein